MPSHTVLQATTRHAGWDGDIQFYVCEQTCLLCRHALSFVLVHFLLLHLLLLPATTCSGIHAFPPRLLRDTYDCVLKLVRPLPTTILCSAIYHLILLDTCWHLSLIYGWSSEYFIRYALFYWHYSFSAVGEDGHALHS